MSFLHRSILLSLLGLLAATSLQTVKAQTPVKSIPSPVSDSLGTVKWHVSSEIDSLEKSARGRNELRGYRVQVFLGNMTDAKNFRQKALASGLTQPAYIIQNAPDYAVRMGDFKSLFEAQLFLLEAKKHFASAFLVNDKIEPPRYKRLLP